MIYYELLKDGTIGRYTNHKQIAIINNYYNETQVVENSADIIVAYNGKCYLKGTEPQKPQELIEKEKQVDYENKIVAEIRKKYTGNQELAILRQRDAKPEEFAEYNEYVEQCKAKVKEELEN